MGNYFVIEPYIHPFPSFALISRPSFGQLYLCQKARYCSDLLIFHTRGGKKQPVWFSLQKKCPFYGNFTAVNAVQSRAENVRSMLTFLRWNAIPWCRCHKTRSLTT